MGDVNNLFGNTETDLTNVTAEEALAGLVGEGKKYGTAAELAKAMLHGQVHIGTLERENAGMRDTEAKAKGVDDILAALKEQGTPAPAAQQLPADQQAAANEQPSVTDLIAQAFDKRDADEQSVKEKANQKNVIDTLAKTYGTSAAQIYAEVGAKLNIDLDALSAKSPQAVLNLVAQARPAQATDTGLPPSSHQTQMEGLETGVLNSTAINKMYSEGKIKNLAAKRKLENEQLTLLGDKFYE